MGWPEPPARGRAAPWQVLVVAIVALGLSLALFHRAWPRPFSTLIGGAGDADEYTWFLAWVPFALGHGLNPLGSTYVNAPHGVNLMWNTSVLLPSLLMSPVTVIFGTAFSYNILVTVAPVLNASVGYVAFRRWARPWPAAAGAFAFAFSPYMASQSGGHLAQVLIASAPAALILLDRLLVVQAGRPWRDGILLGLLAWAQLLTGEEVLAMEALTAAVGIVVLAAMARREVRSRSRYAARGAAVAGAVFLALSAPFLAYQFFGPNQVQNAHQARSYATDLLNFFVPTGTTELAPAAALRASSHFRGSEHSAYLGIPLLVFVVLAVVLARRRKVTWVALAAGAGAAVLSLGATLHVGGHVVGLWLPGRVLAHLPLWRNLLPGRFASMVSLAVGLLVALGLDELDRRPRPTRLPGWALLAAGLAGILPTFHFSNSAAPILTGFYTGWVCPPAHHPPVTLVVPADDEVDLRWQAQANFCFAMPTATGMTGTSRASHRQTGLLFELGNPSFTLPPLTAAVRAEAAREIRQAGITAIIVAPQSPAVPNWSWAQMNQTAGWLQQLLGRAPQKSTDIYYTYVWKDLSPPGTSPPRG